MGWRDYETLLAIRGDRAGVRLYFLDGQIELTSPAKTHERRKTTLARLLELWALDKRVDLDGFGSWTLKQEHREAGAEPDECYILGPDKDVPDLVIEVEWSRSVGLDKREIYRRLGVAELWTLTNDGALVIRTLEHDAWTERPASRLLPNLDVTELMSFVDVEPQSRAVRSYQDALRQHDG